MTHRQYGFHITPYWKVRLRYYVDCIGYYRAWIYVSIAVAFMIVFGAIALYQQDATRNLMMVNDVENQKIDKIEQERLFLYR
jgi:uncharacterized membrane protein